MWLPLLLGSLVSAGVQNSAAKRSAKMQKKAGAKADTMLKPYADAGVNALGAFMSELGLGTAPEGYGGYSESPMARYLLEKGTDAIDASAAMRGGLYSGATLSALDRQRHDIVATDFGDYLNRLGGMTASGQNAAAGRGNVAMGTAAGVGNAYQNAANAISGGISDMAGIYGYFGGQGLMEGANNPLGTWVGGSLRMNNSFIPRPRPPFPGY